MNCLAPLTTHSPSASSALVRDVAGVGAGLGLGQARRRPGARRCTVAAAIRSFCFVAAPEVESASSPSEGWAAIVMQTEESDPGQLFDRQHVGERVPPPPPPYSCGKRDPPSTPAPQLGDDLVRETASPGPSSSATGRTSWAGEVADGLSRISFCSGESSKFMPVSLFVPWSRGGRGEESENGPSLARPRDSPHGDLARPRYS